MKIKLIYFLVVLGVNISSAQIIKTKEELIKKIATESCECTNRKQDVKSNFDILKQELVSCITSSFNSNYIVIQFVCQVRNKTEMVHLIYEDVVFEMARNCPKIFSKLEKRKNILEGKVVKVEKGQLIIIEDGSSVDNNLRILNKFSGSDLIIQNKLKKGDAVFYNYTEMELYDSKIKDFRKYKVIILLEKK